MYWCISLLHALTALIMLIPRVRHRTTFCPPSCSCWVFGQSTGEKLMLKRLVFLFLFLFHFVHVLILHVILLKYHFPSSAFLPVCLWAFWIVSCVSLVWAWLWYSTRLHLLFWQLVHIPQGLLLTGRTLFVLLLWGLFPSLCLMQFDGFQYWCWFFSDFLSWGLYFCMLSRQWFFFLIAGLGTPLSIFRKVCLVLLCYFNGFLPLGLYFFFCFWRIALLAIVFFLTLPCVTTWRSLFYPFLVCGVYKK